MNSLQPGQTYEITNAYLGTIDKLPTRIIVHGLTNEQQKKIAKSSYTRKKLSLIY